MGEIKAFIGHGPHALTAAWRATGEGGTLIGDREFLNVYPAFVREQVKNLRAMPGAFVIYTNNPLVINELKPEEVTLVTLHEGGEVRHTLMKDTTNFKQRSGIYALGELWLSYCSENPAEPTLTGEDDE